MQSWLIRPQRKKSSSAPTAIIRTVKAWRKRWEEVLSIPTLRLEMRLVRPGSSFRIFPWLFLVILHESRPLFPVPNWQEWPLPSGVFCCWSPSSWRLFRLVYHLQSAHSPTSEQQPRHDNIHLNPLSFPIWMLSFIFSWTTFVAQN